MTRPLVGFGVVRHVRLRPRRHTFTYRTYFLLLPMRQLRADPALAGPLAWNRRGSLSFHDEDHGDGRGPDAGGALAWIDELMRTHGVVDADGEIWLHTMPRVLGYGFNPVSFWYCHRADGSLRCVLAEVNNTFGERHCYLLDPARYGEELSARKAFHVSPFCDVAGRYRFRFLRSDPDATNPAEGTRTVVRIDHDDESGPLLQTSVSGRLEAISSTSLRRAAWAFPAQTAMVMGRIHWQALRLWWQGAGFRAKPLPPGTFVTPASTATPVSTSHLVSVVEVSPP